MGARVITVSGPALSRAAIEAKVGYVVLRPGLTVRNQVVGGSSEDDVVARPNPDGTLTVEPRTLLGQLFLSLLVQGAY